MSWASTPPAHTEISRPPKIQKASRFEEAVAIRMRATELLHNKTMPRVPLHSSISGRCDEYFIALSEHRQRMSGATTHRTTGSFELDNNMHCLNSY